jgi:cyclopropane-fatty-acyl-phospholipid synthase
MQAVLDHVLRRMITRGGLRVIWPDGGTTFYQGTEGPVAALRFTTRRVVWRMVHHPAMAFCEGHMDGEIEPVDCTLYALMDLLVANLHGEGEPHAVRLRIALGTLMRRLAQFNPVGRARRNVAHHYDLNGRLYSLLLDRDRQYSCAYFPTGTETLDEAQAAKKRHIAAKLLLDRPGLEVLDIGCGWGGMALTLARDYGARVTGITLSQEQLDAARARAREMGLEDRVRFEMQDYRALDRTYDRIVSVGMFEHVGLGHYGEFFSTVRRSLTPGGVALVHAIGRSDGPGATNPWLAKYIFPGGYSPALSEVLPHAERSGLMVTDIEILRLHYAATLQAWRRNFHAKRDAIATLYDERFCRMFELYLCGSELSFRHMGHMVWQMQLAVPVSPGGEVAVPLTRDYIREAEAAALPGERMLST